MPPQRPIAEPELSEQNIPPDGSPKIEQIDPSRVVLAANRMTLRIFGYNFNDESEVRFDNVPRRLSFINQNLVVVELVNSDFVAPGAIVVTMVNSDKISNAKTLLIESPGEALGTWYFLLWKFEISQELRLLLLTISIGALGASIIALQSIADYRGQRKLTNSWVMFYLVRPFVGAGVALVFYVVIRGGFLAGTDIDARTTTPYGIVAVAALVGMFSDKAVLKLNEVFLTLFKTEDDRGDKLVDLSIDDTTLPNATINQPYSYKLTAQGGKLPYQWSAKNLPADLTINSETGEITGTPKAPKSDDVYTFTVKDDRGVTANIDLKLIVE